MEINEGNSEDGYNDAIMYTAMTIDHDDNMAQVKDVYYKEMADLLKKATGAEHVEMFHHQVPFPKMVFGDKNFARASERLIQFITFTFCKKIP